MLIFLDGPRNDVRLPACRCPGRRKPFRPGVSRPGEPRWNRGAPPWAGPQRASRACIVTYVARARRLLSGFVRQSRRRRPGLTACGCVRV